MTSLKQFAISAAAGLAIALLATAASAATTVKVELWDKGADMEMAKGLLYAAPGADMSKATMGIKVDRTSAPAGDVTFDVTNISKDTIHEMIVIQLKEPGKPIPFDENTSRVDEEAAGDRGEVSELDPGKSGSLTVDLAPGKYLLICNVAGHYAAGMWTEFEVTK